MGNYFLQILIALDQLINTIFNGWADETISARSYRTNNKLAMKLINTLFFWQKEHCKGAYESEILRTQFPVEYRTK
jgi:hypothetical protein